MRALRIDRRIFSLAVLLYTGVIGFQKAKGYSSEWAFPFFAWDLFVTVPDHIKEEVILIEQIDSRVLAPPRDLRLYWRPLRRHDPANHFSTPDELERAVERGSVSEVSRIEEEIRARYFPGARSCIFSLNERDFDPLEYWADRTKMSFRRQKEFHFVNAHPDLPPEASQP